MKSLKWTFSLLFLLSVKGWGAIAWDASSDSGGLPGSAPSWTHTCTGSSLVLVAFASGNGNTSVVHGAKYNGVVMTTITITAQEPSGWIASWYLTNPATGAHTLTVTFSGASANTASWGTATSFTGANTLDNSTWTFATSNVTSSTITINSANSWTVDLAYTGVSTGTMTAGGSQTERTNKNDTGNVQQIGQSTAGPLPSGQFLDTWTLDRSRAWIQMIVSISAGGLTATPYVGDGIN